MPFWCRCYASLLRRCGDWALALADPCCMSRVAVVRVCWFRSLRRLGARRARRCVGVGAGARSIREERPARFVLSSGCRRRSVVRRVVRLLWPVTAPMLLVAVVIGVGPSVHCQCLSALGGPPYAGVSGLGYRLPWCGARCRGVLGCLRQNVGVPGGKVLGSVRQ